MIKTFQAQMNIAMTRILGFQQNRQYVEFVDYTDVKSLPFIATIESNFDII